MKPINGIEKNVKSLARVTTDRGACGMPPSVARAPSLCSLVSKSSQSGARTRCMATRAATSSPPSTLLAESARMGARGRLLATGWAKL